MDTNEDKLLTRAELISIIKDEVDMMDDNTLVYLFNRYIAPANKGDLYLHPIVVAPNGMFLER
jgi:hypothetical protein